MVYLRYRAPDGAEFADDAALIEVTDRLGHAGADYWSIGAGDAALWAGSRFNPTQLQFYFDGADRFQLRFVAPGAMPLVSQAAVGEARGSARILVGGDPMLLASGTLVSRSAACGAARYFVAHVGPDPAVAWE